MTTLVLVLIIVLTIVVVGGGVALLTSRRGDTSLPPPDVLDEITHEIIDHPERPEPQLETGDEEPPFEESLSDLERPEAPQGRLVRLRGRLA